MLNQFAFLRAFETTLFVWCYSFASIIINKEGWENEFLVSLVEALLYTIFTFAAGSFLPTLVTHVLIQLSLPPNLDERHVQILLRTLRDDDPALLDLARTGAEDIQHAITRINVHNNRPVRTASGPIRVNSGWSGASSLAGGLRQRAGTADSVETSNSVSAGSPTSASPPPRSPPVVQFAMDKPAASLTATLTAAPAPGSLADALSAVLATPEGLGLVQTMVEEAARVRVLQLERASAPLSDAVAREPQQDMDASL